MDESVTLKIFTGINQEYHFELLYALQLLFLGELYVYVVSIKRLFINRI